MNNELYHHGILGMKWGVRRTKAQLGYPTTTKKRTKSTKERIKSIDERSKAKAKKIVKEGREQAKIDKANAKAKARIEKAEAKIGKAKTTGESQKKTTSEQNDKPSSKSKTKSMNGMTNEELQSAIDRLNLERNYKQLYSQVNPQPPKVEKGKNFAKRFLDDAVKPAAVEAGKDVLKKFAIDRAEKALGLKSGTVKDPLNELKKEAEKYDYKSKILESKRKIDRNEQYFKDKEAAKEENKKQAEAAKAEAQRQVDEYNQREYSQYHYATRNKSSNTSTGNVEDVYSTVINNSQSSNRTDGTNRYNNSYINTTVDDISVETVSTGKSYINELGNTTIAGLLGSGNKEKDK